MNFIEFINNNKKLIIVVIVIFLFCCGFIYAYLKREKDIPYPVAEYTTYVDLKSEINEYSNPFENIRYPEGILNNLVIPESLPVYEFQDNEFPEEFYLSIIDKLGMKISERINLGLPNEIILANKVNESLTIYKENRIISYDVRDNVESNINYNLNPSISIEEYQKVAEQFIENITDKSDNYIYDSYNYRAYPNLEPEIVESLSEAGLIELIYYANVNGYPLIDQKGNLIPSRISVWINKDLEVIKSNVKFVGEIGKDIYDVQLREKNEILKQVDSGNVILVNTGLPVGEDIRDVRITKMELDYYTINNRAIPVIVASTINKSYNLQQGEGKLFIDAVKIGSTNQNETD